MKRLLFYVEIFALFFLLFSGTAFSKSEENKAACERWCNANKPRCVKCDSNALCGGRTLDVIKSFKKGSGNWYACGMSDYEKETQKNKSECEAYCRSNPACVKCTADACGTGVKILKTFSGKGENWRACEKTDWAKHSEEAHSKAITWCADYKKETGEECKIVKSGQSCPDGFYRSDRITVSWGRDYKVCLKSKSDTQRVRGCSGKATANIEKALAWINSHYGEIVDDFRMQPSDYRDRRAHDRLDRKFPDVTVDCEDHTNKCKDKPNLKGWSAHGRHVNLCYNHFEKFCNLVGTIVHESGHNAWVNMERSQHRGKDAPGAADDTVFQFGYKARDKCIDKGADYPLK